MPSEVRVKYASFDTCPNFKTLTGNGKTALICNISPSTLSYHETISTLRFGARCQLVQNVVRANLKLRSRAELDKLLSAAESIIFLQKAQIKQSQLKQVLEFMHVHFLFILP
jgi:hypothetical protein